jgi:hypothetical protein
VKRAMIIIAESIAAESWLVVRALDMIPSER